MRDSSPSSRRAVPGRRAGFTLVELLVAVLVLVIIAGTAVTFLIGQNRAYADGMGRTETAQNLRYVMRQLETNLATVGTQVPSGQPVVVYASESMVVFHADYATNLPDDPSAVYFTPGAPTGQVSTPSAPLTLPGTGILYPTTVYQASGGIPSPAEMIILRFIPDDLSDTPGDFALVRQVNDADPQVIARNLRRVGGDAPFFRYFQHRLEPGTGIVLDTIPADTLPVIHPDAGGATTRADSIRGIRVQVASAASVRRDESPELAASRAIWFPNAERTGAEIPLCGENPLLGVPLVAALDLSSGAPEVVLTWDAAQDEVGGEQDVLRYLIWRQTPSDPDWGDPYRSIPSGASSYTWRDVAVTPGESYTYALAAQDCTPSLSTRVVSGTVTIPLPTP